VNEKTTKNLVNSSGVHDTIGLKVKAWRERGGRKQRVGR